MVLAVRDKWRAGLVEWKKSNSNEVIGVKLNKKKYLIIVASMNEEKERNREEIERWMEEDLERRVIICGDFNTGTGTRGVWGEEGDREERRSRDEIVNGEGRELIDWLNETGLSI